ncbi:hypothetical protein ACOSQ3_008940 [Xanthoceras sorbifolium]
MMIHGQDPECLFHKLKILQVKSDESTVLPLGIIQRLHNLKKLVLQELKDLKYMWEQNSKLNLMLPAVSFQNLTILEVNGCHTLENIVTSSMAKSLVNLIKMSIWDCTKITEVVGNQGEVTEDKIIFSNLKSLSLLQLPSLTSFCSWSFILEFPSLKEIDVDLCMNMKFSLEET